MKMIKLEGEGFTFYIDPECIETIAVADIEQGLIKIHTVSGDEHYLMMSWFTGFSDIDEFLEAVTLALCGEISEPNLTEIRRKDEEENG